MTAKSACFVAAFISSAPIIVGLENSEMNLLKLLFYPLMWRCLCDKLIEVGLIPRLPGGDILGYMIACTPIPYAYMLERHSNIPSVQKIVDQYSQANFLENRTYRFAQISTRQNIA